MRSLNLEGPNEFKDVQNCPSSIWHRGAGRLESSHLFQLTRISPGSLDPSLLEGILEQMRPPPVKDGGFWRGNRAFPDFYE